jgi:hypothetical protein
VVTFGVLRSSDEVKAPEAGIAKINSTPQVLPIPESSVVPLLTAESKVSESKQMVPVNNGNEAAKKHFRMALSTGSRSAASTVKPEALVEPPQPTDANLAGTRTVIIKHRSGEARVVNLSEYNLGLQTANLRATPKGSANKEQTFAANIF